MSMLRIEVRKRNAHDALFIFNIVFFGLWLNIQFVREIVYTIERFNKFAVLIALHLL